MPTIRPEDRCRSVATHTDGVMPVSVAAVLRSEAFAEDLNAADPPPVAAAPQRRSSVVAALLRKASVALAQHRHAGPHAAMPSIARLP